ncbi:MAG: ankyrin repeat domain-containing protein [Candidatus Binatus sp.]
MISKTKLSELVKQFRWKEVDAALAERPELLSVRDQRGRNWLHLCCGVNPKRAKLKAEDSVKTAELLLRRGLDINQEAFTEGDWKATPLWFAIARGENLTLAQYLLKRGSNSNYCLWAAAFVENIEAIRLLVRHAANVNDPSVDESPFLGAIKWSHFKAAEELLELGADVNYQDSKGMTALHYMLKKASDKKHFAMLLRHGARGDIKNKDGVTAAEIMRQKKDSQFRAMADQLLSVRASRAGAMRGRELKFRV